MRQQCGADASGPPSSCEPGSPRSEALVLELPSLSRGQAQREKSLRSARVALAQLRLVATPPDDPRRVRAKIVNSISWGLRRSLLRDCLKTSPEACLQVDTFSGHLTGAQSPQNNMITSVQRCWMASSGRGK